MSQVGNRSSIPRIEDCAAAVAVHDGIAENWDQTGYQNSQACRSHQDFEYRLARWTVREPAAAATQIVAKVMRQTLLSGASMFFCRMVRFDA